jgi:hypothetical protein
MRVSEPEIPYSPLAVRNLTHFFLLLRDVLPLDAGRLVFLPFTHGPRGFVLIWSTINAFAAASRGVSKKRLMECAMPLLHLFSKRACSHQLPARHASSFGGS